MGKALKTMAKKSTPKSPKNVKDESLQFPPWLVSFVKTHLHAISRGLIVMISLLVLIYIAQLSSAATTDFSQTITAAAETVTVVTPNGGESWTVGTTQNITWSTTGTVNNVVIELQRTPAGAWETIAATTPDDGAYPWTVAGTATTTAKIRISDFDNLLTNDESDAVFTIVAAAVVPPSQGSGYQLPTVDNVYYSVTYDLIETGETVYNDQTRFFIVEGRFFQDGAHVYLGDIVLSTRFVDHQHLEFILPKNFSPGAYTLKVVNPRGMPGVWGNKFIVGKLPEIVEQPSAPGQYEAEWVAQSASRIKIDPGESATVWVEFKNIGTQPWFSHSSSPVRLATTHPQGRESYFTDASWINETRVTSVTAVGGRVPATIQPGENGRFTFALRAPTTVGSYREFFALVAEPNNWFWDKGLYWDIQVGDAAFNLREIITRPIPATPTDVSPYGLGLFSNTISTLLDFLAEYWYWLLFFVAIYLWLRAQAEHHWYIPPITNKRRRKQERGKLVLTPQ